ncbi:MAG: glycosyltransferase [Ignavibacteria bacterium]|jgi:cellulose synthase/poly-beta-1,6-N-acetylglucosamine synthase-like glycosyltransferase|nr:glycosyltransferase [Ignavibacteria bacterium]MCU7501803.1 glycosyltransferase [Ignavibacteria bacterium]MCU7518276.1 glycosyltransferase [Ignavibacteria bacterium]
MFEVIFLIAVGLYFLQSFLLLVGAGKKYKKIPYEELPTVSVIVAARNEEGNIERCLKSLDGLVYPEGKLEIIIVDDNSTDNTRSIVDKFISDKPKFRCISTSHAIDHLKGKTNALANALEIAGGEVIMTTDADCQVGPQWAESIASYYEKDVAMVCGYTTQEATDQFSGMQMLDFMYLLTVAAGSMNLNFPLSCIGNNMSYRKSAYRETGGYENLPFSVTEDFNLLHAMNRLGKYKIIYPLEAGALVESKPCESLKSLYWQKKRWGVGGLDSDIKGFLIMASGFLANLGMVLFPFFFSLTAFYVAVFKLATDLFMLYPVLKKFNLVKKLKYFASFEVYFIVYVLWLPFAVIPSRKVIWKGRNY